MPSSVITFTVIKISQSAAEWTGTYGTHHWKIVRSSYRGLAWIRFQPKNTKLHTNGLTSWAIKPWVQGLNIYICSLYTCNIYIYIDIYVAYIYIYKH